MPQKRITNLDFREKFKIEKESSPTLSVTEFAKAVFLSRQTIYLWVKSGKIEGFQNSTLLGKTVRGHWRIPKSEIERVKANYI